MKRMILIWVALLACACQGCISIHSSDPGVRGVNECYQTQVTVVVETSKGRGAFTAVILEVQEDRTFFLTAAHCEPPTMFYNLVFTYMGKEYADPDARFVHLDEDEDLALIVSTLVIPGSRAAVLAQELPAIGSTLYTAGNKYATGMWPARGIYAGTITELGMPECGRATIPSHPGNSGGGVFYDCELVGILSSVIQYRTKIANTPFTALVMSADLMFFVPLHTIRSYLASSEVSNILKSGEYPAQVESLTVFMTVILK